MFEAFDEQRQLKLAQIRQCFYFGQHFKHIENKCASALNCFEKARTLVSSSFKSVEVFFWLETGLYHTSGISYAFFPPRSRNATKNDAYQARASVLCALFELQNDVGLLKDRSIRDHFVHYDERIDNLWIDGNPMGGARGLVGPRGVASPAHLPGQDTGVYEHYIPDEDILVLWGKEISIDSLKIILIQLQSKADELFDMSSDPFRRIEFIRRLDFAG